MKTKLKTEAFEAALNRRFDIALAREGTSLTERDRDIWQFFDLVGAVKDYAHGQSRWLDELIAEARGEA